MDCAKYEKVFQISERQTISLKYTCAPAQLKWQIKLSLWLFYLWYQETIKGQSCFILYRDRYASDGSFHIIV
jgi:hypothetical protein